MGQKYPQITKSWRVNWDELTTYFRYPEEMRGLFIPQIQWKGFTGCSKIYKDQVDYPTDEAVKKSVYLSIQEITKKWSMPVQNWGIIIGQLMIF